MLAELVGVDRARVRSWQRRGWLVPVEETHRLAYFDFAALAAARQLAELHRAGIKPAVIERKLAELARRSPGAARTLAELSIVLDGRQLQLFTEDVGQLVERDVDLEHVLARVFSGLARAVTLFFRFTADRIAGVAVTLADAALLLVTMASIVAMLLCLGGGAARQSRAARFCRVSSGWTHRCRVSIASCTSPITSLARSGRDSPAGADRPAPLMTLCAMA